MLEVMAAPKHRILPEGEGRYIAERKSKFFLFSWVLNLRSAQIHMPVKSVIGVTAASITSSRPSASTDRGFSRNHYSNDILAYCA